MAAELLITADSAVLESNLHKLIYDTYSEILFFFLILPSKTSGKYADFSE